MAVKRKVYSVNVQMILAIIPIVDLWAAYRIEKLRLWILFLIGMTIMGFFIGLIIGEPTSSSIVGFFLGAIIAVVLMRHLTMEWNEDILIEGKNSENEEDDDTETRYKLD